jgi:hypothetical protein
VREDSDVNVDIAGRDTEMPPAGVELADDEVALDEILEGEIAGGFPSPGMESGPGVYLVRS